ncbi:MAG TPA: dinitrogenase iron-molybdenum cofactor biosynthesis protein [Deltaproteobacteria bacterium]|nr:dinitrogenase iron-molybdenum cofactor biosynthesis protein [Deltaproteobacteria bacterium]
MRIAVVSTDGINVDEHFGKASRFLIYELTGTGVTLIEQREVQPYSDNVADHSFNPDRFACLKAVLADCARVYVAKVGERPAEELGKAGIEPVVYQGPIAAIS